MDTPSNVQASENFAQTPFQEKMSHGEENVVIKWALVENLAAETNDANLKSLFGLLQTPFLVRTCNIVFREEGNGRKSAIISAPEHVQAEVLKLNGIEFFGKKLRISSYNGT